MSRRASLHAAAPALEPIPSTTLAAVTGGLMTPRTTLDPVLLEGIKQLSSAIVAVGQNLAASKQASSQRMMEMMQQLMQMRRR